MPRVWFDEGAEILGRSLLLIDVGDALYTAAHLFNRTPFVTLAKVQMQGARSDQGGHVRCVTELDGARE